MQFDVPLIYGHLKKRYKRFFADIELDSGESITAHCPNTGSMKNCLDPDCPVWVRPVDDPKRKLKFTWELVQTSTGDWACINTSRANALVKEAIAHHRIPELDGYEQIKTEVRYGDEKSRIDLLLSDSKKSDCYVEIKNVTLLEADGIGYFPDAVSQRGTKHLRELTAMVKQGFRAVLFFNVCHTGIHTVKPASHIDPEYSETLKLAINQGVEVLAYRCTISPTRIECEEPVTFSL